MGFTGDHFNPRHTPRAGTFLDSHFSYKFLTVFAILFSKS